MKSLMFLAALGAVLLSGCGNTIGVSPAPREVQEGHGGDGFAAVFVHAGQVALSEYRTDGPPGATDQASLDRFERRLSNTPIYSTENLSRFPGKPVPWEGVEYARIIKAPRGGQPVIMLSRPYFRPLIGNDQIHLAARIGNLVIRAIQEIEPDIHIPTNGTFRYIGYRANLSGVSIHDYASRVLNEIDDSPLIGCSGWNWLKQLVASVPVEETDHRLVEWTTGLEVDAVVVRAGSAGWKIYSNRQRMSSLPQGSPRALLSVHEYLRASEVAAIDRDENYRVSSLVFQNALWASARALPAATGAAAVIATVSETLCLNLKHAYGLPK